MARLRVGESEAERNLQAHIDELAIVKHAERLKTIAGYDRALEALAVAVRAIAPKPSLGKEQDNDMGGGQQPKNRAPSQSSKPGQPQQNGTPQKRP